LNDCRIPNKSVYNHKQPSEDTPKVKKQKNIEKSKKNNKSKDEATKKAKKTREKQKKQ
jgi:hypothetical protein